MKTPKPGIHTSLTVDDVDTIHACQKRILNAAVLLELGLNHMNDDTPPIDAESIQLALLDVVDRLREDATLLRARMEEASLRMPPTADDVLVAIREAGKKAGAR